MQLLVVLKLNKGGAKRRPLKSEQQKTNMDKMQQNILCIASDKLFKYGKWQGLQTKHLETYYQLLLQESEFRIRGELEKDPNYKQIIPQIVLRHQHKYFLHQIKNGTESRLQDMMPLPLGGHVEEFDQNQEKDILQTALERELYEEVTIDSQIISKEFLGLIYLENGNSVNHVHVALAYLYELDGTDVHIAEDGLEEIGFVDLQYLQANTNNLNYWSRVIVDRLAQQNISR